MKDATLVNKQPFRSSGQEVSYLFKLDSVEAGGGTEEFRLAIEEGATGVLKCLRAVCDSTDFDLSLRCKQGVTAPDITEVYDEISINKETHQNGLERFYWNRSSEDYLYVYIKNDDGANATGEIDVELTISRMGPPAEHHKF